MNFIPISEPSLGKEEKENLIDCIDSGWISSIGKYIPQFQGYDQHDAQEFMGMILDKLNEELTTIVPISLFQSSPSKKNTSESASNLEKKQSQDESGKKVENKVSVIDDMFCGELCNTIICPNCKKVKENYEKFYYLT